MQKLRITILAATVVAFVVSLGLVGAKDLPKAELISGEVVSLTNYMVNGLNGEENLESSVFHVERRGLPVAILDKENGELYIVVNKGVTSPTAKLTPFMGKMVNAQGPIYRAHGIQLIEVQIVAEQ